MGYEQYNSETRREDFNRAFHEVVERTIELKPDFMIISGDLFHHARPTNITLENAIVNFKRLRDVGIPVLTVDGSHDAAPNIITGTILNPLDSAGLIYYLPRHESASWRRKDYYVYGIPNFRTRRKTEEQLPNFYEVKKPKPDPSLFNVFVFHMALDIPVISKKIPKVATEASPAFIPDGFNYYAGGHVHTPWQIPFKGGILTYSGCTETVNYDDARVHKGFYHVKVDHDGELQINRIRLESPRHFIILDYDYSGMMPERITELAARYVRDSDEPGAVIVPILRGMLPAEANRREIDLTKIRNASEKALLVRPMLRLAEKGIPEEVIRSIFDGKMKDLKTKAFEYFYQFFSQRYPKDEAERNSRLALELIQPLVKGEENKVKDLLEDALSED